MKNLEHRLVNCDGRVVVNIIAGLTYRIVFSGKQLVKRFFPFGDAYSCKAAFHEATLPYTMNQHFNLTDLNVGRLRWDFFAAYLWTENRR